MLRIMECDASVTSTERSQSQYKLAETDISMFRRMVGSKIAVFCDQIFNPNANSAHRM